MGFKIPLAAAAILLVFPKNVHSWPWSADVVKTDLPNLNWVVDEVLTKVSNEITIEHGESMIIPGSNLNWKRSLNFYVLWFEAYVSVVSKEEATIENLNSIKRTANAGILQRSEEDSEMVTLQALIQIEDLKIRYNSVDVGVWFVTYSGGLTVKCPDNVFDITLQFENGESCKSTLMSAMIKELPSCTVELDESGLINWFKRHVIDFAFQQMSSTIIESENAILPTILDPIIKEHDMCKFLNPKASAGLN